MEDLITLSISGGVAEVMLNRPAKLNAVTAEMAAFLLDLTRRLDEDSEVSVVLLHGAGERAFCAGSDLNSLAEYPTLWAYRNRKEYSAAFRHLRKPLVVALQGWALGGGAEMALSADIRIADTSAKIGFPEVKRGWVGGGAATQLLPRLIGYGASMRLLLTGDHVDAAEAFRLGLVEEVVAPGQALERARALCAQMAGVRPLVLEATKAAVRASLSLPLEAGAAYENEMTTLCFAEGRHMDGIRDFFSKRDHA
ncbi:MAG: enoyl-CoA hydratase/isomerase family protein [Alphaproteobacteria bacterium]|nr:enoyl-CoA hydratase/isomerase family protein [Alphaproteobacteria bacterium]MBU1561527.1 enoyl-CoA hydratase/isomerase family protein [Alphaproteobacteria bacterium]MBU2302640.1 enoyl-CoA hydratase/isomerase family protein [Alphaproteobacteria bacterium]MBU2367714.1 enoyl-CoA hydratase/isomerase family protein [Alphaproteobacteria bacterium]